MSKEWTKATLAACIDHTILKATANEEEIRELCNEARIHGFASVCVNPYWVKFCSKELSGSKVPVCTVVGFPLGANSTAIKAEETRQAIENGAREIDMVINLGALKSGNWKAVEEDIKAVVKAAKDVTVKLIIETCYLNESEKTRACELALKTGVDFVKTSTGFGSGGANVDDIKLIKNTLAGKLKIKASGGIRSYHDAIRMLEAGADRLGASSGIAIISELPE